MIKYKALIKTVELGSITKAAKELGYSQPGISHMLDALEAEVGFPLLKRNKDRIVLNENGKKVLNYCIKIVKDFDDLQRTKENITSLMTGNINIGALNSTMASFVPKAVSNFLNAHSNVKFRLEEHSYQDLQVKLMNGSIDIAFTSEAKTKGISFFPLYDEEIFLVLPKEHPFARYETVPAKALQGCDFIMPMPGWDDLVNIVLENINIKPNVKHMVASDVAALSLVAKSQGVYIISRDQTENLRQDVVIKPFEGHIYRKIGYAVRKTRQLSPAVRAFVNSAKQIAEIHSQKEK